MFAARLYAPRKIVVEEVEKPGPPPGWALVKTAAVGICGTDKAFYTGSYPLFKAPLIPGHEVVGVVVEGPEELVGSLVLPEINFPCGRCSYCRRGLYTHCPYKKTLGIDFDGGFAEYFVAPVQALHVADGLDPVTATEVEPLAALIHGLRMYPPEPYSKIAVVGTGNLAYMLVQLLRGLGFEDLVVVARRGSPKASAFRGLVAEVVYVDEAFSYVRRNTDEGQGFDYVFDVSGDPSALNLAIEVARPRGTVHVKSTPGAEGSANMTRAVVKELRIVGTRCGTWEDFEAAIKLLRSGTVKPNITAVFKGLEKAPEAFEQALDRKQFKVVVTVE